MLLKRIRNLLSNVFLKERKFRFPYGLKVAMMIMSLASLGFCVIITLITMTRPHIEHIHSLYSQIETDGNPETIKDAHKAAVELSEFIRQTYTVEEHTSVNSKIIPEEQFWHWAQNLDNYATILETLMNNPKQDYTYWTMTLPTLRDKAYQATEDYAMYPHMKGCLYGFGESAICVFIAWVFLIPWRFKGEPSDTQVLY